VIDTILVAVDDTPAAAAAAVVAVDLATAMGAHLIAISVLDGGHADVVRAAQQHVAHLADRAGLRVDLRTVHSAAPGALLDEARSTGADLVVVGRLDPKAGGPAALSPTAEHALDFGDLPVLVVPAASNGQRSA
jgi:nucleotide-binding universal stress UspA family protein